MNMKNTTTMRRKWRNSAMVYAECKDASLNMERCHRILYIHEVGGINLYIYIRAVNRLKKIN